MATETVSNAPGVLAEARDRTMLRAAREAAALAAMLRRETHDIEEFADSELVLPGTLMRIEALCTSVCILQGPMWKESLGDEDRVVFGRPLEVAHG